MTLIKLTNVGLRFLLELCLLLVFGYWGFRTGESNVTKFLLGLGSPILAAMAWGTLLAPKAATRLQEPWLFFIEIVLFGLAVWALAENGRTSLAIFLGTVYILNKVLMLIWHQ
ncbi:MAG: YrdB family protein [Anaerolineales bacterium]|nr:YrdB family protein [Anaerolineales bacterium]